MNELLSVKDVANSLRVSQRQVWSLNSSGRLPAPLRISRSVRWRTDDLDLWIALGCPDRAEYEARRAVELAR